MRLFDWLQDKIYSLNEKEFIEQSNGLHVIGTCGNCKWWDLPDELDMAGCISWDSPLDFSGGPEVPELKLPKNFGCIHWEGK